MLRRRFHAMGTQVEFVLDTQPSALAFRALRSAEAGLRRLERLLSRFDPDSELSRLNQRRTTAVGPELLELVELALGAREWSKGRFDPTVHDALVAAGYDRTFDELSERALKPPGDLAPCGGGVVVDRSGSRVELAPGVHLDLGGIAKGYAADRAVASLAQVGASLVDVGGDIAVTRRPWPIGVETADGTLTLELAEGALATSGADRRHWMRGGREQHHLIDPATGLPAASDLLRVTVAAASAVEAEVLAKTLFLAGASSAHEQAKSDGIPAVLVTHDRQTVLAGGLG